MDRVAFLTAAFLAQDPPADPEASREHALQLGVLGRACSDQGIELVPVVWNDPDADVRGCAAVVIGTAWDYAEDPAGFLERLSCFSQDAPLFNPLETVRWNMEKTYLRDLESRDVPVVPTQWCERADAATIDGAYDALRTDVIVVKPLVGQHSWRQARLRRGDPLPPAEALPPAWAMIQPYLPSIETEGELSFVCVGRELSHGVRKRPAQGDYRIQASFGGSEEAHAAAPAERSVVAAALATIEGPLLQARVDLVRGLDGALQVMELELIEPYLYPEQASSPSQVGERFARGLRALLR